MTNYEYRRGEIDRVNAQGIKPHFVSGRTVISGAGEALVPVAFPVVFVDEPTFYFGGVLVDGFDLTGSAFPTVSAIVSSWDKETKNGTNFGYLYSGASIVVVTSGPADLQMWLHWSFFGNALRNPA